MARGARESAGHQWRGEVAPVTREIRAGPNPTGPAASTCTRLRTGRTRPPANYSCVVTGLLCPARVDERATRQRFAVPDRRIPVHVPSQCPPRRGVPRGRTARRDRMQDPGLRRRPRRHLHRGRGAGRYLGRDQVRTTDRRARRGLLPRLRPHQRRPAQHRRDHVRVLRHHGRTRPGGRGQARRAGARDPGPAGAERELGRVLLPRLTPRRGDLVLAGLPLHPPEDRDHRRDEGRHHDGEPDQPVLRDVTGLPGGRYRTGRRLRHHHRV